MRRFKAFLLVALLFSCSAKKKAVEREKTTEKSVIETEIKSDIKKVDSASLVTVDTFFINDRSKSTVKIFTPATDSTEMTVKPIPGGGLIIKGGTVKIEDKQSETRAGKKNETTRTTKNTSKTTENTKNTSATTKTTKTTTKKKSVFRVPVFWLILAAVAYIVYRNRKKIYSFIIGIRL